MVITMAELQKRLGDILKIVGERGIKEIKTEDGKTLEENLEDLKKILEDLKTKNDGLEKEVKELKENNLTFEQLTEIFGKENFKDGKYKGSLTNSSGGDTGNSGEETESQKTEKA
jgi:hypothetical protein